MKFQKRARFLHERPHERPTTEDTMRGLNKNNAHEGAVCITGNGAAARCALGLLVVVVLLLSVP